MLIISVFIFYNCFMWQSGENWTGIPKDKWRHENVINGETIDEGAGVRARTDRCWSGYTREIQDGVNQIINYIF